MHIDLIDKFLEAKRKAGRSSKTIKEYKNDLRRFYDWLGNKVILKVTKLDIEEYLKREASRRNKNGKLLSENTVARRFKSIKYFFNYLEEKGHIKKAPSQSIKRTSPRCRKGETLTLGQIQGFFKSLEKAPLRIRVYAMVLYGTGLRLSELVKLKVGDVDLSKSSIVIREGRSRKFYIHKKIVRVIRKYKKECKVVNKANPQRWLFPGRNGSHVDVKTVRVKVNEYLRKVPGCKKASAHWLRVTFFIHMQYKGVNLVALEYIIGHKSVFSSWFYKYIGMGEYDRIPEQVDIKKLASIDLFSNCSNL